MPKNWGISLPGRLQFYRNSNYEDGYIGIFPPSVKDLSFVKLEQGRRHKKILERVFKGFQTLILEKTVWIL